MFFSIVPLALVSLITYYLHEPVQKSCFVFPYVPRHDFGIQIFHLTSLGRIRTMVGR
jgi:hypothetical protein